MAIPATQLRPGMVIKHNNDLHSVFSVEHRTPGNLRAFIQAKLRNLRTGAMFEHRFRSADALEKITVDEVQMEYLYNDGDDYYFMNTENYEQTHLTRDILGDSVDYLISNLQIKVEFFDGQAVGIELPPDWTCDDAAASRSAVLAIAPSLPPHRSILPSHGEPIANATHALTRELWEKLRVAGAPNGG